MIREEIVQFEISVLSRNTFNFFIVQVSRYMMKMDTYFTVDDAFRQKIDKLVEEADRSRG
jgi:hypothetical protein